MLLIKKKNKNLNFSFRKLSKNSKLNLNCIFMIVKKNCDFRISNYFFLKFNTHKFLCVLFFKFYKISMKYTKNPKFLVLGQKHSYCEIYILYFIFNLDLYYDLW